MNNTISSQHQYLRNCGKFADRILQHRYDLVRILSKYETFETANDEIERSIEALKGLSEEFSDIKHPLSNLTISTFFPLNLPLYSLVLFGIVPGAYSQNVFIRPPEVMNKMIGEIFEFLDIQGLFPNVSLHSLPRYVFMSLYASESDVIIFTGKYENAIAIQKQCPQALLIYNGSGINPFILFENADLELAAEKAVEMRCFNSGQDCAGPDAFFVPATMAHNFVSKLEQRLKDIKVGDSKDPDVRVSRTMKETYLLQLQPLIENERENIIYGGEVDNVKRLVHPTVIVKPLAEHTENTFHEFFAPVFYVLEYESTAELEPVLLSEAFIEQTMYITIFGNNKKLESKLSFATILKNAIVNDVETGNSQYGGYGSKANFLLYGNQKEVHPILISRDMHSILAPEV